MQKSQPTHNMLNFVIVVLILISMNVNGDVYLPMKADSTVKQTEWTEDSKT